MKNHIKILRWKLFIHICLSWSNRLILQQICRCEYKDNGGHFHFIHFYRLNLCNSFLKNHTHAHYTPTCEHTCLSIIYLKRIEGKIKNKLQNRKNAETSNQPPIKANNWQIVCKCVCVWWTATLPLLMNKRTIYRAYVKSIVEA